MMVTPEMALSLLDHNKVNRPLSDLHVRRIARQITASRWKFNGDTIKISDTGNVLDGQHRLWAIAESGIAVETIVIYGVPEDAFSTIDTTRKMRTGGDVVALSGQLRYRAAISTALTWLLRWQRGILEDYRAPQNRIENYDIEDAWAAHPEMVRAVEQATKIRGVVTPSLMGFIYYITASKNSDLADRMMNTLENPAAVAASDPFFTLRTYLMGVRGTRKDAVSVIAICFKAINAAHQGKRPSVLRWKSQGKSAEAFPKLEI